MAKQLDHITDDLQAFIQAQKIFFVATAAETGTVNLSPKGMDSFRILGPNRVMWLNVTGSGNETAAHLLHNDRITIMFCAFEGKPLILRLYGHGKTYHSGSAEWSEYYPLFAPLEGARQLIDIQVNLVQSSCGMAVPFMDYNREREDLAIWARKQSPDGIQNYWARKNMVSIDGFDTGIFASPSASDNKN
ncbi:pyridoxamine 5'-phosphate oxidase family protein [Dyadobacter sp. CY261]|uniref:pyridoxamine 5'-phosphate oxidase family protein n=1 Tax=Dyadobacter sp. CY261 TaxID=2907203 RepID=UPI001F38DF6A|nr:pyridoxamine 5'-phosphate oxidase family protein [Dyadobacter sp. CY261]MCF0070056.1 pyridoxamine 5'-phosphate oxidase family protein [Dyadobacter sp. CY261]